MRLLLCCAALALGLVVGACGSDSDSSTNAGGDQPATSASTAARTTPAQNTFFYTNKYPRPRNPGPHPNARIDQLVIRDIRKGKGAALQAGDTGTFEFIATNYDTGAPLEAAWHKRRPFETQIEHNVVIDGWWQGIPGMRVGGRRQIIIPPSLGFTTNPELAGATTYFDVVLNFIRPLQPRGLGGGGEGGGTATPPAGGNAIPIG